jgi:hypothetical protein
MTALYPSSVKSFTTKVDFTDTVLAEHVNSLQDEVKSLEATLGTYISVGSGWVGSFDQVTTNWNTLKDRLANIEYGLNSIYTSGTLPSQSGQAGKYLTTDGSNASWATVAQGGETISSFLLAGC